MSVTSISNLTISSQQVAAAKKALRMHDIQNQALIEDITLRAGILRKVDPSLINEQRLKTGIRVIDAVINLFYQLNTRIYKKRIQEHLAPYQLALNELTQERKKRIKLVYNLYTKCCVNLEELEKACPGTLSAKKQIRSLNVKFSPTTGLQYDRLRLDQINPNFGKQ